MGGHAALVLCILWAVGAVAGESAVVLDYFFHERERIFRWMYRRTDATVGGTYHSVVFFGSKSRKEGLPSWSVDVVLRIVANDVIGGG